MQINYDFSNRSANSAGFLNWVGIDSVLRDVTNPAVYAPYATSGYWPAFPGRSNIQNADMVNGGFGNPTNLTPLTQLPLPNVHSVTMANLGRIGDATPAATPEQSVALPVGAVSLVSPLPSITPPKQDQVSSVPPVDTCPISNWIASNQALAAVGAIGIFLLFARRSK